MLDKLLRETNLQITAEGSLKHVRLRSHQNSESVVVRQNGCQRSEPPQNGWLGAVWHLCSTMSEVNSR